MANYLTESTIMSRRAKLRATTERSRNSVAIVWVGPLEPAQDRRPGQITPDVAVLRHAPGLQVLHGGFWRRHDLGPGS